MTSAREPGRLYELLGVERDAPAAEITRAYHRRARDLHPDAQPGQAGEPARFRELEEAYRVLRDPARRAVYDRALAPRPGSAAAAPRPPAARSPGWPATRLPGATLQAGPVQVIPPSGDPAWPGAVDARLASLAGYLARHLGGGWPW